jgi:hypothetical protein
MRLVELAVTALMVNPTGTAMVVAPMGTSSCVLLETPIGVMGDNRVAENVFHSWSVNVPLLLSAPTATSAPLLVR